MKYSEGLVLIVGARLPVLKGELVNEMSFVGRSPSV